VRELWPPVIGESARKKQSLSQNYSGKAERKGKNMQNVEIVRLKGNRWYVRYWERRNVDGVIEQKRVSHCLGVVTTRGKRSPADIENAAKAHMATVAHLLPA
jgi:hypothetical protein